MAALSPTASAVKLQVLEDYYQQLKQGFLNKYPQVKEWLLQQQIELDQLRTVPQQLITVGAMAGSLWLSQVHDGNVVRQIQAAENQEDLELQKKIKAEEQQAILDKLNSLVQQPAGHLNPQDELYLEQQLSDMFGFEVTAELEGHRLNHSIGIMGGEQHLKRFPTDTIEQHDAYQESGIAPNRGAFGWFTESGTLTPEAIAREKYYFAVQTLYLPDWNSNHAELKPWYKFRKMIVVNPADQVAVVGVVGDAGPAQWVKKQFGGSPEVIREGKVWSRAARGHVLLFFVDDPEDKIPLGPIDMAALAAKGLEVTSL
jgi:hypothetical protein